MFADSDVTLSQFHLGAQNNVTGNFDRCGSLKPGRVARTVLERGLGLAHATTVAASESTTKVRHSPTWAPAKAPAPAQV